MTEGKPPLTVAAVDLGSNSFHMVIARVLGGEMQLIDKVREPVRLAAGLNGKAMLTDKAQKRAFEALARIAERLVGVPEEYVRVVGTNTLRRARNAAEFRTQAEEILGHPIEIISGTEEARLIYEGVCHDQPTDSPRQLVVDIGGGSTEIIIGEGDEVLLAHSLYMGCVSYSMRFFGEETITREQFKQAQIAARLETRSIERQLTAISWEETVGSSGTVRSIERILTLNGMSAKGVTLSGLKKLRKLLVAHGSTRGLELEGIKPNRADVLPGGLAILIAVFESLGIDRMKASSFALREGVVHDLVGRIRRDDVRNQTINQLARRYHVDLAQATRVESTALDLFAQAGFGDEPNGQVWRRILRWAARLHEVGLAVSYSGYHKHGAYLLTHSTMPGFAFDDQMLLAAVIRGQRRKFSRVYFDHLPKKRQEPALKLCALFRLAVLLHRARSGEQVPRIGLNVQGTKFELAFPQGWLQEHPLTAADLEKEQSYAKSAGLKLNLVELEAAEEVEATEG